MGKGKQRIDMKHITDKSKRRVTFSKRRQGLFKKALQLDTLCGSRTSVVSVSDAGTVFTAGSIHPSLIDRLLSSHGGLEMLGLDELGTVLATLKKTQHSVELLLEKRKKEEEEAVAAAVCFPRKDPTFADGTTATFLSGFSSFGYSGSDGYGDFEGSISGYTEIEDLLMGGDNCSDFGAFGTGYAAIEDLLMGGYQVFDGAVGGPSSSTPGSEEELNSFESELMYLF